VRKPQPGIKDKRRGCIKPRKGQRVKRSQRCTRYVAVGSFIHRDRAGDNKFHFTGARDTSKNGRTTSLKFPHHPLVRQAAKLRAERRFSTRRPAPARRTKRQRQRASAPRQQTLVEQVGSRPHGCHGRFR
jgi:hypothetical protein